MTSAKDGYKVCEECGGFYFQYCLRCAKSGLEERVWALMNQHNLNETELIRILAEQVVSGSFPALNLAITMRDMKPANKVEVNDSAGKDINDARDRISNLLSRLSRNNTKDK